MSPRDPRFGSRLTARQTVAVLLAVVAVVWLLVNGPVEGPILVVFTPAHGLSTADLPSLAALAVAVALFWPRRRG
ncbi:hypothetical protein [uncultured Friedmanniella sp.]|uniref:hypothetical protein n=1 Tax=uncultured Friedmanniella sp. TaxID=335381 RepID=UPI0035CBB126